MPSSRLSLDFTESFARNGRTFYVLYYRTHLVHEDGHEKRFAGEQAFSGAEVRHGPIALVNPDLPVLVFAPAGPTMDSTLALAAELAAGRGTGASERRTEMPGARVFVASPAAALGVPALPVTAPLHPALDPIPLAQAFYRFAERLARARGHDPDKPSALSKVTRTL